MSLKNCFAYSTKSNGICVCSVLTDMVCEGKKCSFFKTKEQDVIKKYYKKNNLIGEIK